MGNSNLTAVFAANLRRILDEEDITPAMLAEWAGISKQTIRKWLKGNVLPQAETLEKAVQVLKRPLEELYREVAGWPGVEVVG